MSEAACQIGDLVLVRGPCSGTEGIIEAIDDLTSVATLQTTVFGKKVPLTVSLTHVCQRDSKKARSVWKRHISKFLPGHEAALQCYLASWHGRGFLQERLSARVDQFVKKSVIRSTVFELDSDAQWKPVKTTSRDLTENEWREFFRRLSACSFWDLAPEDRENMGLDGETWTLEGTQNGKYHRVERWTTGIGKAFGQACTYLAILAGVWPSGDSCYADN